MRWSPISADWLAAGSEDDDHPVEDAATLTLAENEVRLFQPMTANAILAPDWAVVLQPAKVSGFLTNPGTNAFMITSCLDAANIEYVWFPYPPQLMPGYRAGDGAVDRPFALLVPPAYFDEASRLLLELGFTTSDWSAFSVPVTPNRTQEAEEFRLWRAWLLVAIWGINVVALMLLSALYVLIHALRDLFRHVGWLP